MCSGESKRARVWGACRLSVQSSDLSQLHRGPQFAHCSNEPIHGHVIAGSVLPLVPYEARINETQQLPQLRLDDGPPFRDLLVALRVRVPLATRSPRWCLLQLDRRSSVEPVTAERDGAVPAGVDAG